MSLLVNQCAEQVNFEVKRSLAEKNLTYRELQLFPSLIQTNIFFMR